jgi:hypothetical protein
MSWSLLETLLICSHARSRRDLPFPAGIGVPAGEIESCAFATSRFSADEGRPAFGQTAVGDLAETDDAGRALCNSILMSGLRQVNRHPKPPSSASNLPGRSKAMADCKLAALMKLLSV